MRKKQMAAIALALWLTIVSVFMLLMQRFDLQIFFVLYLIAICVIVDLMEPQYVQPGCLRYKGYLLAAGIEIFGAIFVLQVMVLLAQ